MNSSISFALIGCGAISKFHAEAICALDGAQLSGVYDPVFESAQNMAARYQVACYSSYEALLNDPSVNAVSICTPSGLHAQQAIRAIEAGKHVLVEKPIALNLEDCDQIITLAREKKVLVSVVSQLRFSKEIQRVKEAVENGLLGRIVSADLYMKYHRPPSYYKQNPWRGTVSMDGGGALMNQGIHGVDLLRYLAGPLKSIFAQARTLVHSIEVEDTLSAVVEFSSGSLGVIQATTSLYPGFPRRLEIHGELGSIILEEDTIALWTVAGEPEINLPKRSISYEGHRDPTKIDPAGHIAQYQNFISAIFGKEPLLVDAVEGRRTLEIIVKAYESSRAEQIVYFDEEPEK
ncbi:MAG: Gfo/Idh/MocA family oxidoreductase [Clostridia bacterium]|nr:Gfo/Idh/MocA family oxidoreductase [Clostridia bacterium]